VIAPNQQALRAGSAKLIVDGTDTTLVRKAEISLGPSRVAARSLTQLLNLSRDIYNGALQHRRDAWQMTRNSDHPTSISRRAPASPAWQPAAPAPLSKGLD
jgi:hypothetical protein